MPTNFWRRDILALILPLQCLGCGKESDWICADCRRELRLSREERCFCGKTGESGLCAKHQASLGLDGLTTLFSYADLAVRGLITQIKYHGHTDAVNFLARYYQKKVLARLPRDEWIVTAVPLSAERRRHRGFNQSKLIAQKLTEPVYDYHELIIKKRDTQAQVELKRVERQKNLVRAFVVKPDVKIPERIILVDDVITTGSTLKEIAKTLRRAGAQQIWALTVAHG